MQCRGNSKRHTMANPEDVHSLQTSTSAGARTRRTGLLTVMERPPGKFFILLGLICLVFVECIFNIAHYDEISNNINIFNNKWNIFKVFLYTNVKNIAFIDAEIVRYSNKCHIYEGVLCLYNFLLY